MRKILSFLQPAPYLPVVKNASEIDKDYRYWRMRICYSIFAGYAVFYFTRKSFTFALPYMQHELGYTKADLGALASLFYIIYGTSKFLSGVLSDRSNPRYFMAIGLILTGVMNIFFGLCSSIWALAIFWGLNGWFQGWGWPACCKQLNYWYDKSERGLWYSICSTSHNIGGALIPLIVVYFVHTLNLGWRWGMFVPAILSILMGFFLINRMRDVPRSLGLPTVEDYKNKTSTTPSKSDEVHSTLSVKEILFKHVLNNKFVWMLSTAYFFVYVVRTGINDWGFSYLNEARGMSDTLAMSGVSWFEVGGILGMIVTGWCSDYFWKGNRIPVMLWCAAGLIISIIALMYIPIEYAYLDLVFFGLIGMFVFGPQMIVGLAAAEFVDKRAAATSNGFAGNLAYFGAAMAGQPLGAIIESSWGWQGFFYVIVGSAIIVLLALLPASAKLSKPKAKTSLQWNEAPTQAIKEI